MPDKKLEYFSLKCEKQFIWLQKKIYNLLNNNYYLIISMSSYYIYDDNCKVFHEKSTNIFSLLLFEALFQQGEPSRKIVVLLSILLLCHSGQSKSQTRNQEEMFQILYSSWSAIRIPNCLVWQKKYFFSKPYLNRSRWQYNLI